ncbi:MAG: hypothetical protein Q9209_000414 [Squamulea sp. 1 TL-2023]
MTTSFTDHSSPQPTSSKPAPFRFKRKHPKDFSASDLPPTKRRSHSPSTTGRTHRHRHHHRRQHRSRHPRSPSPITDHQLDPETAFRESLFDALADDEGAAFWESVYGQPIHTYSPFIRFNGNDPEQAELQRMTDDEYATYVRARMWEKSHAHIVEERLHREAKNSRRKEREQQHRDWERDVEDALRRGDERRRKNRWKDAWGKYLKGWEALSSPGHEKAKEMKHHIPWPVETGRYRDVDRERVEIFFQNAPQSARPDESLDLRKVLKTERFRWHPDKFLQKAGGVRLDGEIIAMVTAVFQIIDRLWSEMRLI